MHITRSKSDGHLFKFLKHKHPKKNKSKIKNNSSPNGMDNNANDDSLLDNNGPATLNEERLKELQRRHSTSSKRKKRKQNVSIRPSTSSSRSRTRSRSRSRSNVQDSSFSKESIQKDATKSTSFDLPEISSVYNSSLKRRSLQNSTQGLDKFLNKHTREKPSEKLTLMNTNTSNTLGVSNILVSLDDHSDLNVSDTKSKDNSTIMAKDNSSTIVKDGAIIDKRHTSMLLTQMTKTTTLKSISTLNNLNSNGNTTVNHEEHTEDHSGIMNTLMSITHNATSHLPKIIVRNFDNSNQLDDTFDFETNSIKGNVNDNDNDKHNDNDNDSKNNMQPIESNKKDMGDLKDIQNDLQHETVIHSSLNVISRSNSFLRHLDFLLSTPASNGSSKLKEQNLLIDTNLKDTTTTTTTATPKANTIGKESTTSKIKFESIKDNSNNDTEITVNDDIVITPIEDPPSFSTFGKGNLSLQDLSVDTEYQHANIRLPSLMNDHDQVHPNSALNSNNNSNRNSLINANTANLKSRMNSNQNATTIPNSKIRHSFEDVQSKRFSGSSFSRFKGINEENCLPSKISSNNQMVVSNSNPDLKKPKLRPLSRSAVSETNLVEFRSRSKTVPANSSKRESNFSEPNLIPNLNITNDISSEISSLYHSDNEDEQIQFNIRNKKNLTKRYNTFDTKRTVPINPNTKRYSSYSNEEDLYKNSSPSNSIQNLTSLNNGNATDALMMDERKSRRSSKNFLMPRSLSPSTSLSVKNLHSFGLAKSKQLYNNPLHLNPNTNSNSLPINDDSSRPKISTSLSNTMDPALNIPLCDGNVKFKNIDYASEKKNSSFHSFFKNINGISPDEKLIIDITCALSRDILQQGKMYITDRNICFNANILGWVSTIVIPFTDIVQIKKKMTAGIFPNAIVIDTLETKYVFASFISRDSVFDLITDVWNQIILGRRRSNLSSARHHEGNDIDSKMSVDSYDSDSDYSSENDYSTDTDTDLENSDDKLNKTNNNLEDRNELSNLNSDDDGYNEDDSDVEIETDMTSSDIDDEKPNVSTLNHSNNGNSSKSRSNSATTKTKDDTSNYGPIKHSPTTHPYKPTPNDRQVINATFNYPMGIVSNMILGDNVDYYHEILNDQKNFDFSTIPKIIISKNRDFSYVKPLSVPMGPSKTNCLINEVLDHYDLSDYIQMTQISKTPDVPSGNAFYVKSRYLFTWGPNNTTKLEAYSTVEWTGKSWLKSAIEKGTYEGVKETGQETVKSMERILKTASKSSTGNSKNSTSKAATSRPRKSKSVSKESKRESDNTFNGLPCMEPKTHLPTEHSYQKEKDDTIIEENVNINAPLGTVFQILYGKDTSYYTNILKAQGNLKISKIEPFSDKNNNMREYSYIKPLSNSLGPKQTTCSITEKLEHMDLNKYIRVRTIVKTPDVPSGNNFSIHVKTLLTWGPNNTTNLDMYTSVIWTGRSFLKSAIERGSIDGQKESAKILLKELKSIIATAKVTKPVAASQRKKNKSSSRSVEPTPQPQVLPVSEDISSQMGLESSNVESSQAPTSSNSSFLTPIIDNLFGDLDIFSISGILKIILSVITFISLIRYFFVGKKNDFEIVKPGRMVMNGVEYNFVPNVKTLYRIYEEDVRRSVKSNYDGHNLIEETEGGIWEWIHDRGYGGYEPFTEKEIDRKNSTQGRIVGQNALQHYKIKKHKYQQLKESIRIAELQLDELKEKLSQLE
ncbi:hypothetical protein TBLA_0H01880 [Henningerozyma blattae CBS 6284]|uniref:VASt domain-containing protein n=1 Tax=Henningerozyma blattae (strain ATCC 34711 / CBS 6284 / DSM 70876 / NBRC 10599 / NRRL Y-10934 / UCD 77-7) TaxID=1071380 RepID=I2H7X2_HENB6|nr:hypothetical protein TBLA_0H01880 [Tetrapisispora blattae CBS 6284]CCH62474.1 hypothetical protein TBLA_0H01880 [Tetrapisispora blattae CBS 6284]